VAIVVLPLTICTFLLISHLAAVSCSICPCYKEPKFTIPFFLVTAPLFVLLLLLFLSCYIDLSPMYKAVTLDLLIAGILYSLLQTTMKNPEPSPPPFVYVPLQHFEVLLA